jgi:hypothetical protein
MHCSHCGKNMSDEAFARPECGHSNQNTANSNASSKNVFTAILLCIFFGVFGAHRFYVGKIGTGVIQLLTLGGFAIWAPIDLTMLILGKFTDKAGRVLSQNPVPVQQYSQVPHATVTATATDRAQHILPEHAMHEIILSNVSQELASPAQPYKQILLWGGLGIFILLLVGLWG